MIRLRIASTYMALLVAGTALSPAAQAGFDFVPPSRAMTPASQAPMAAETIVPVDVAPIDAPQASMPVHEIAVTPNVPNPDPVGISPYDVPIRTQNPTPWVQQPTTPTPQVVMPTPAHTAITSPTATPAVRGNAYPPIVNRPAAPLTGTRRIEPDTMRGTISRQPPQQRPSEPDVRVTPSPSVTPPPSPVTYAPQPAPVYVAPTPHYQAQPVMAVPVPQTYAPAPAPRAIAVVQGFGNGIPLSLATQQIVPSDYTVQYMAQPDPDTIVSWSGGRPWDKVLEDMLYAHGFRVKVDGSNVTIYAASQSVAIPPRQTMPPLAVQAQPPVVAPAPVYVPEPVPAPIQMAPVNSPQTYAPAQAPQPILATPPVARPIAGVKYDANKMDIYSARSGETLRDVLGRWSDQSMVQLYWQANQDYKLPQAVAYNTTYTRAVQKLLAMFIDADGHPTAEFHPNAPMGPAVLTVNSADQDTFTIR